MANVKNDEIREAVRRTYGKVAKADGEECCCDCDCGSTDTPTLEQQSAALGYSPQDVSSAPEGANLGLGCGNPQALASLKPGETVLDLGSGGGFDCFLAAGAVGKEGRVIGVDMTPEMLAKARANAEKAGAENVEFRLGEIEALPVADSSVDVIISNCVINLSPQKPKVFEEALRVLKPGGRLAVADIVATAPLPEEAREDLALLAECVSGAAQIGELEAALTQAGFTDVSITPTDESKEILRQWQPGGRVQDYVVAANITATKPGPARLAASGNV